MVEGCGEVAHDLLIEEFLRHGKYDLVASGVTALKRGQLVEADLLLRSVVLIRRGSSIARLGKPVAGGADEGIHP